MNALLFERSTGNLGPNAFARLQTTSLLTSFSPAPRFRFDGGERATGEGPSAAASSASLWAHQAGVTALAVERFDGRILISGGSDATIKIWDLEQCPNPSHPQQQHTYRPVAVIPRAGRHDQLSSPSHHPRRPPSSTSPSSSIAPPPQPSSSSTGHRYSLTHLSFYPFDAQAFLSTSHDATLKLWSTAHASLAGSFPLGARAYTHATSPLPSQSSHALLVACGTQHPATRLVDLRSAAAVQALVPPGITGGAAGAVLAVGWSPRDEHVLAVGSADGGVRVWDVRRVGAGVGPVGVLDVEDTVGLMSYQPGEGGGGVGGGGRERGREREGVRLSTKAHAGPVNGLAWTDDGGYLVTSGHDGQIRVWDAATGANTLASFGPRIRGGGGSHMATTSMFVSPEGLTHPGRELLFFPNESEVLVLDLHEGTTVARMRWPGLGTGVAAVGTQGGGVRGVRNRVTSLAWRGAGGVGGSSGVVMGGRNAAGGIYSGHMDGQIRPWLPRLEGAEDEAEDPTNAKEEDADDSRSKSKKRKALDDAFRSLMGKQITFT